MRPLLVRAPGGIDQLLHAIAFGKVRARRRLPLSIASRKRLASRDTGAMRPSGYCAIGRVVDRDARRAPPAALA